MNDQCPTYEVTIYIAGDLETAKATCRRFCDMIGLCVTVSPTTYIYTGGQEDGVRVGLINYPKYPAEPEHIRSKAFQLAWVLRGSLGQQSFSVVTPDETYWDDLREDGGKA